MPKVGTNRICSYVAEFGENIFASDGGVLFCKMCEIKVNSDKRFCVTQHIKTEKHARAVNRKAKKNSLTQPLITTPSSRKSDFNKDLCKALLKSNIPFEKLSNTHFRSFLEKYVDKDIPSISTLRKTYVEDCYQETMDEIRNEVKNKKIWVSIDSDSEGRYVANVIIGTLPVDEPGKHFLLASEVLEKANHTTISKLFDKALFSLWPKGIQYDDVILFVSDAAPYMVKAGKSIQTFYSKMIHVTCLAHGLHRVCEKIRAEFPKVDELISNMKKVFLKAPARIELFRREAADTPLPPSPIITRWGTWLKTAMYYCEHFKTIKKVVNMLDADDALAIEKVKQIICDKNVQSNLIFIHTNYGFLISAINSLETRGTPLVEEIQIVDNVIKKLKEIKVPKGVIIYNKLEQVVEKNEGFKILSTISKVMSGEETTTDDLPEDLQISDFIHFKYAPISSVDVERSFSLYKNMLADNRRSFVFENLSKSLVVNCNS